MWQDLKLKFKWQYDKTFWMHLLREVIITFALSFIHYYFAIGFALGVDTAWEYQDNLLNDGFNLCDWVAGIIGIGIALMFHSYFF